MSDLPHYGINRRDLDRLWLRAGGAIEKVHRTGEARYVYPGVPRSVVVNARRKDTSRALVRFVRDVLSTTAPEAP